MDGEAWRAAVPWGRKKSDRTPGLFPLFLLALVSFLTCPRGPSTSFQFLLLCTSLFCETPSYGVQLPWFPWILRSASSTLRVCCALPQCPIPMLKPGNSQSSMLGICQAHLVYFPSFRSHCSLLSDVSKNGALCILSVVLFSGRR